MTPLAVRDRLVESGDPGFGLTSSFEGGRVNAFGAVRDVFLEGLRYANHPPGDVMLLADVTGDGRADLIRGTAGVGFEVAKNKGSKRKFKSMRLRSATPPAQFTGSGDANGDGREDLILGDGAGFRVIRAKNNKGGLLPVESWSAEPLGDFALTGDVNGDGLSDVVNHSGGTFDALLSTGTAFGPALAWSNASAGTSTALADADGDGKADLILWVDTGSATAISVGPSSGTAFGTPVAWGTGPELDFVAAADFDGDGKADLLGVDPASGCLSVFVSTGSAFEDPRVWTCPGAATHILAGRTDKDRDARADVVIRHAATGEWRMLQSAH